MKTLGSLLISAYLWIIFALTSCLCTIPAVLIRILTAPFDKRMYLLQQFSCFWGALYIWLSPLWPLTIIGREKADKKRTYVMVSNHQSYLDIPAVYCTFLFFKWVAKASLFRAPFIGIHMKLNRYVRIERSSVSSQRQMIRQCISYLRNGISVMLFPEGTRSEDGNMRPFKTGAFHIAQETRTDILPMAIVGTREVMPKSGFIFRHFHRIYLYILDPIPYADIAGLTEREAAAFVREKIQEGLNRHVES